MLKTVLGKFQIVTFELSESKVLQERRQTWPRLEREAIKQSEACCRLLLEYKCLQTLLGND